MADSGGAAAKALRQVRPMPAPWGERCCCVVVEAGDAAAVATAQAVVREMGAAILAVGCDMDSFQGFSDEVAGLPGKYDTAVGGRLLLCMEGAAGDWERSSAVPEERCLGCIALRNVAGEAGCAEIKRLFAREGRARGQRLGQGLTIAIAREAERLGYDRLVLDTLERLPHAVRLYESLGFRRRDAYVHNPEADAVFFEIDLATLLASVGGEASAAEGAATAAAGSG